MDDKLLMETAVLAGEIMLVSGAEIYRVEDTINRILCSTKLRKAEAIVFSTGIFATLEDVSIGAVTVARRVTDRSTNLNRVYLVNDVSRKLCNKDITVEEAYYRLIRIQTELQYRPWLKSVGIIGVAVFFALLLGADLRNSIAAAVIGAVLAAVAYSTARINLNDFCANAVSSFIVALTVLCLNHFVLPGLQADTLIISAIMPLVPGVIFTTAIRDTLNGDYASGIARILEAVVVALAVAAGVGAGMMLFQQIIGGLTVW